MRSSLRATLALLVAAVLLPATTLTATAAEANDTPADAAATQLGQTYAQESSPLPAEHALLPAAAAACRRSQHGPLLQGP